MKARIVKIGNSQGIRIPKPMLEESGIGEAVDLVLEKNQIVIRPSKDIREGWEDEFIAGGTSNTDRLLEEYQMLQNQWDEEEWQW